MKRVGILRFPGTNCDRDVWRSVERAGHQPQWLWHGDHFSEDSCDAYVVPGGFSYGDYLRSGALAALSPVVKSLKSAAQKGAPVFGICNGFQILCEAELLPGTLMSNNHGKFVDKFVDLKLENKALWTPSEVGKTYRMPLAHGDGRYFIEDDGRKALEDNGQIWLSYGENPNGSVQNIAGVMNRNKNVVALMPHPDRATDLWMGSDDGLAFFQWQEA